MGIFNWLFGKSALQKALTKLREKDLGTMAGLIEDYVKQGNNQAFGETRKKMECDMLKENFNLQKGPASESLNRFKWAKDICEEYNFTEGANIMQNYIDVYIIYIKDYCD